MNSYEPDTIQTMKRCICGKSKNFPICDGQHGSQGWTCSIPTSINAKQCILAGPHYLSLAEKLAHHLDAVSAHSQQERIKCNELIILSDGTDINFINEELRLIQSNSQKLLAINAPVSVVAKAFPTINNIHQITDDLRFMWTNCLQALQQVAVQKQDHYSSLFISHSVQDEHFLLPIIQYIRKHFDISIFLCTDSIKSGSNWYQTITDQLHNSEKIIAINSASFATSTFCAFEMGLARSLQKELSIINLDDTSLPAYIQDIQSQFANRYKRNKPWLTLQEAVSELLLQELHKSAH